jgi:quinoprotein relay system zinc metallohydrolase 1
MLPQAKVRNMIIDYGCEITMAMNLNSHFSRILVGVVLAWAQALLPVSAAPLEYTLTPQKVADNTYLVQGKRESFSRLNGGNIVNTAFVITKEGVVVIDSGPSKRYGEALRAAIQRVTDVPVTDLFLTHHHPDHFLGNQAFTDVRIWALPKTGQLIAEQGNDLATNLYGLVGDWMRGTEVAMPNKPIEQVEFSLGGHTFQLIPLKGHTGADLALFDTRTQVLFAGDMIFYQRALATPNTPGLKTWIEEMSVVEGLNARQVIPGHGPVVEPESALTQMREYLTWLDQLLTESAEAGLTMNEVINQPIPKQFQEIALTQYELMRTVFHLYADYESAAF